MRIAMLYIAEAYQCYHGHTVALALDAMNDVTVSVLYNDPSTLAHCDRIERAFGQSVRDRRMLEPGLPGKMIQSVKLLGMAKNQVMQHNLAELMAYDAIIAMETTVSYLHRATNGRHPPLIYMSHGSGDRAIAWHPWTADFDLALVSGGKTLDRLLDLGLVRPGQAAAIGDIKYEIAMRLADTETSPFDNNGTIVLYNPHKEPRQTSWPRAIEPMLREFGRQPDHNLIVAPHVKMFRRRGRHVREKWNSRSTANIHIDTGSDRCVDGSYTAMADIYVGDVSSQVYEFTARPRPCVFLNMHNLDWRDNPEYRFWDMGEVVNSPNDIMAAIRRAPDEHHRYVQAQRDLTAASLGDLRPGGSQRAASAIYDFVKNGILTTDPAVVAGRHEH